MSPSPPGDTPDRRDAARPRLFAPATWPIYYGWVLVATAFITMGVGVNARTAFSLFFPPILREFGWERGVVAGAFSFGFIVSAVLSPLVGKLMDLKGPRVVVETGVFILAAGLLLAPLGNEPWQIYATLGLLTGCGANFLGYSVHSQLLPNWFVRQRGLAVGVAFAGVGIGSVILLPGLQWLIERDGWRAACVALGLLVLLLLAPLNLLLKRRPQDIGLQPDGDPPADAPGAPKAVSNIVDARWAAIDWTLSRAMRTHRYWWLCGAFFTSMYSWYAVQIHQTQYLIEVGIAPMQAAWALGFVSLVAIPGQIYLGHLSDRIGREWVWSIACAGFVICCLALVAMARNPSALLLWTMILAQGVLGYSLTSVLGACVAEIYEGPQFGTIFGTIMMIGLAGGATGPWLTGAMHDASGSYVGAFLVSAAASAASALFIWIAGPRKVRTVAGRRARTSGGSGR